MSWYDPDDYLPLTTVEDWGELARRYEVLRRAVRLPGDGTIRLVRREGWVAMPTPEFNVGNVSSWLPVLVLCERERRETLWGLALEDMGWQEPDRWDVGPAGFDVPATLDGLRGFFADILVFSYALLPPDASWVVVTVGQADYYALLGPPKAVETIIERPVEQGYKLFEEEDIPVFESFPKTAESLRRVLTALRDRYPQLTPGDTLALDEPWATWQPPTPAEDAPRARVDLRKPT